jgi:signal recognition particle receptor subunit alpha
MHFQERGGEGRFETDSLVLQFKLDNEFELVFVAGYQKVLKLSYVDKFLDDMHLEIRDRYKNSLLDKRTFLTGLDLGEDYQRILQATEIWSFEMANQPKAMRSFEESKKSKKTVASMIENRPSNNVETKKAKKPKAPAAPMKAAPVSDENENEEESSDEVEMDHDEEANEVAGHGPSSPGGSQVRTAVKGPGGRRTVKNA